MSLGTTVAYWPSIDSKGNVDLSNQKVFHASTIGVLNKSRFEFDCFLLPGEPPSLHDGAGRLNGFSATDALKAFSHSLSTTPEEDDLKWVPWDKCMKVPLVNEVFDDLPDENMELVIAYNQCGLPIITAAVGSWIPEKTDDDDELVQPETWVAVKLSGNQIKKLTEVVRAQFNSHIAVNPNAVSIYLNTL